MIVKRIEFRLAYYVIFETWAFQRLKKRRKKETDTFDSIAENYVCK